LDATSIMKERAMKRHWSVRVFLLATLSVCLSAHASTLYTTSFTGPNGSQPTGFSAYADSGMNSGIDGNEYEQERISDNGVSIAYYSDAADFASGDWRDVTAVTQTRYSGAGNNKNGLIFRARDISSVGTGDFYHVRMEGNALVLWRFNSGSPTQLASIPTTESITAPANRWLRVTAVNVPNPGTDHVQITAELSKNSTFTQVIGTLDFTDTASSAITRSGGVGYRSNNTVGSASRSVFDNLVVTGNNDNLLWYDDYYNTSGPGMQAFLSGGRTQSMVNGKYQSDGSGTMLALINGVDTSAEEWASVSASALMRFNTNSTNGTLSAGLVVGADDVVDTATGDYYLYRVSRLEAASTYQAELLRSNGGVLTSLGTIPLSSSNIPESQNIFLQMIRWGGPGAIHLQTWASLSQDFSNPFAMFDIFDNDPNALGGAGSVGFYASGGGPVNFDNFTVIAVPEPLTLSAALLALGGLSGYLRRRRS